VNFCKCVALFAVFSVLLFADLALAATLSQFPRPPCVAQPVPSYPPPGEAPNVKLWTGSDLGSGWTAPTCTPWPDGAATIVVGLAADSNYRAGADALLIRIGAISSLSEVRYWSVTDKKWNNMFVRATALDGLGSKKPRGDFSAAELRAGSNLYFVAADTRSGRDAISRLHVVAADGAHIVVETENITPLRWGLFTYTAPGSFQTWYFLDRDAGDTWRFYSLTRVLYASPLFASVISNKSYINRAVAMYRHFLNLPTDRGPPPAP
jgi:hypothetical protein